MSDDLCERLTVNTPTTRSSPGSKLSASTDLLEQLQLLVRTLDGWGIPLSGMQIKNATLEIPNLVWSNSPWELLCTTLNDRNPNWTVYSRGTILRARPIAAYYPGRQDQNEFIFQPDLMPPLWNRRP